MGRILANVTICLTAILFALGFVRFAINGFSGDFLPEYAEIQTWFATFPKIADNIKSAILILQKTMDKDVCNPDPSIAGVVIPMECYTGGWEQAGLFMEKIGAFFSILGTILSAPFQVLGWFFVNFFTSTSA